jgi:hypothetical protein
MKNRQQVADRVARLARDVTWGDDPAVLVKRAGTSGEDSVTGRCGSRVRVRDVSTQTIDSGEPAVHARKYGVGRRERLVD